LALPFLLPDGWGWAALASLAIGFTTIQAGIIGHDAGHLAVCRRERTNAMIGHVCLNLLLGVSFSFWRTRHNRHHTQTNDQESDPDLEMGGLFTLNEADAASHRGWRRLVTRYQAYLFVPVVMFVLDLAFRTEGWRHVLRDLRGRRQFIEAALLVLSAVLWATPLFFLGWRWLAIYVGAQWVGNLYLNLVFATNHKGMPTWTSGLPLTFLERQVLSSCNVRPSRAVDYLFNGLNYQIEHHLFPTMPRVNFARARAIIRPFCAEHGLPYEELGVVAAYRQVFQTLDRCGRATRTNVAA
jgi:fatty acid desaturase